MSFDNRLPMKEDPESYNKNNVLPLRDAMICLNEYTDKFLLKKSNFKVIDIGSGDGRVTSILKDYIPDNYECVIGSDMSSKMVEFANAHYQNDRTKFIKLDIENDLPDTLKENFDCVFSFYVLSWIREQQKALTNFYNLLKHEGTCLAICMTYSPLYTIFIALSKSDKWSVYLKNVDKFVSPYYSVQDPDREVKLILEKVGFQNADVKCRQMTFTYESVQKLKDVITSFQPFDIPEDMIQDFLNDCVNVIRKMEMIDDNNKSVRLIYNLLVVYCVK